jgi:hypothetical protein
LDDVVIRSMLKWPDVPDVYGWLRLDRRGNWKLRSEDSAAGDGFGPIGNAAFREFIARNYAEDERGRWYFQNGPQRVYVQLAYAPFVFRAEKAGLVDQCGEASTLLEGAWLDEEGSLIVKVSGKVGLLDDRDLAEIADQVEGGFLRLGTVRVAVASLKSTETEGFFGFVRDPGP